MFTRPTIHLALFACLAMALVADDARAEIEWKQVKSASGAVKSTTKKSGGNNRNNRNNRNQNNRGVNSNYRVKPVYVPFELDSPGMRITYETSGAGDRPLLKIELEVQVERRKGETDWQRVQIVGRTSGDDKGGIILNAAPGKYRFALTGQNTKYTLTVETPDRSE